MRDLSNRLFSIIIPDLKSLKYCVSLWGFEKQCGRVRLSLTCHLQLRFSSAMSLITLLFCLQQVTSKPDLYPLVISYSENNGKTGSYLMVQYFRNYFVAPGGKPLLLHWFWRKTRCFNPLPPSDAVRKQKKCFRGFFQSTIVSLKNITPLKTWNLII